MKHTISEFAYGYGQRRNASECGLAPSRGRPCGYFEFGHQPLNGLFASRKKNGKNSVRSLRRSQIYDWGGRIFSLQPATGAIPTQLQTLVGSGCSKQKARSS